MSGLSQLLQTGLSGLSAATEAMQTVANNTANVSTPGYNAQSVHQTELPGADGGPGSGTDVTSIERAFDQFLYQQGVQASSANQAAQVVQTNAQSLAAIFPVASGGAGGLGSALDSFFSAANQVAQDPASAANRQALLGQAQSLAAEFQSVGGQIAAGLSSIDSQTTAAVQQVNTLTRQIAQLNQAIPAQTTAAGGTPNSLLDQRDELVQQLGQQLGVTIVPGANGVVDVYTSGGAALVNGAAAYQLAVGTGQYGDGAVSVTYGPTGEDLTGKPFGRAARRAARRANPAGQCAKFGWCPRGRCRRRRQRATVARIGSQRQSRATAVFAGRADGLRFSSQYRQRHLDRGADRIPPILPPAILSLPRQPAASRPPTPPPGRSARSATDRCSAWTG